MRKVKIWTALSYTDHQHIVDKFLADNDAEPVSVTITEHHDHMYDGSTGNQWQDLVLIYDPAPPQPVLLESNIIEPVFVEVTQVYKRIAFDETLDMFIGKRDRRYPDNYKGFINSVDKILYHDAAFPGDLHYCDVLWTSGTKDRIYNPDFITYRTPKDPAKVNTTEPINPTTQEAN